MASIPQTAVGTVSSTDVIASRRAAIVVLSEEASLGDALRLAVGEAASVRHVSRAEDAEVLAATAQCGILFTDVTLTPGALGRIVRHIRTHEPALVTIAAGTREQEPALLALLATGTVDHVIVKPLEPQAVRTLLTSADREYRARHAQAGAEQPEDPGTPTHAVGTTRSTRSNRLVVVTGSQSAAATATRPPATHTEAETDAAQTTPVSQPIATAPPARRSRVWLAGIAGAVLAAVAMWWVMSSRLPAVDPAVVIETNLDAARAALTEGRHIEPFNGSAVHYYSAVLALDPTHREARLGIERIAQLTFMQASQALAAGQLKVAEREIGRLRLVRSDDPRLAKLQSELRREREHEAMMARAAARTSTPATSAAQREPMPAAAARAPARAESKAAATRASDREPVRSETTARAKPPELQAPAPHVAPEIIPSAPVITLPAPTLPDPAPRKLVHYVEPEYPIDARRQSIEGWIQFDLRVESNGQVSDAVVREGAERQLFGRAALTSVRQWRYEARPDGSKPETIPVRVTFRLAD